MGVNKTTVRAVLPTPQPSAVTGQQSPRADEWLTANEAAQHLKVKSRTLLRWARQGKIKGYVLSGVSRHVWRFRLVDLDATMLLASVCPEGKGQ